MDMSRTIWVKISKFLTTEKTLNTTKITILQKILYFNILDFYKESLKLPFYKNYHFLIYHNVIKLHPALIFQYISLNSYYKNLLKLYNCNFSKK